VLDRLSEQGSNIALAYATVACLSSSQNNCSSHWLVLDYSTNHCSSIHCKTLSLPAMDIHYLKSGLSQAVTLGSGSPQGYVLAAMTHG
jgi:hypothetical protein